jgi:hypothetical protein
LLAALPADGRQLCPRTQARPGKGDHEIWFSPHTGIRFPVDSKIKSRHTANAVLKQAGLPKHF